MKKTTPPNRDPLRMRTISPEGIFVLPNILCSKRRIEYFERANEILGFYATLAFYSNEGGKAIEATVEKSNIVDSTTFRVKMDKHTIQSTCGVFRKFFQRAGNQLTNQVFLMVYGNFEAFFTDLIHDGFCEQGITNASEEAISLLISSKWEGKFDRISQKLGVQLGKHSRVQKFRDLDMGFLGESCVDPVDFLQRMADLRHRLVHSTGRADSILVSRYPMAGLAEGKFITLPFGLPYDVHFFFVLLTDYLDKAFAKKFGWERTQVAPEELLRKDE